MHPYLAKNETIDFFVTQFPGGGQRGYATVLLLDWFEKQTGLPTHQLCPYVAAGSVGILIASALYLPHPKHPDAALMSAAQLLEIFPHIASKIPQKPAIFTNKNDRTPFADIIGLMIGDAKLKDLLGTVFFSSHEIGGTAESYKAFAKIVNPQTGEATYRGSPETKMLDYALGATALHSIFQSHKGHIDLAYADSYATHLYIMSNLFPRDAKGAFIRMGNFRNIGDKSSKPLHNGGIKHLPELLGGISDNSYSQTLEFAKTLFGDPRVFNLEQEITRDCPEQPTTKAHIATKVQFDKIRHMMERYIKDNQQILTILSNSLKDNALKRIEKCPETAFGIPSIIQEFPLPDIPDMNASTPKKPVYHFTQTARAAGKLVRGAVDLSIAWANSGQPTKPSPPANNDDIETPLQNKGPQ